MGRTILVLFTVIGFSSHETVAGDCKRFLPHAIAAKVDPDALKEVGPPSINDAEGNT